VGLSYYILLYTIIATQENSNIMFISRYMLDNRYCTMLHLFDDLWLDKILPKNNDEGRAI
jgi:hypothetical protein